MGPKPHSDAIARPDSPKANSKKRAPRMSDDEAVEIALRYFDHKRQPSLFQVGAKSALSSSARTDELLKEKGRDATRAWRAVRQAFAHGLVSVISCPRLWIDEELGYRLREAFPQLLGVQVVNLEHVSDKNDRQYDDRIHEELGFAAAKWLSQGMLFQDFSVIGVGSGRGVYCTVNSLKDFPPMGARQVKVMSLTGWVHARNHAGTRGGRDLDADAHAALMSSCFSNQVTLDPLPYPIAHSSQEGRDRIIKRTFLSDAQWSKTRPRYALFGVGVLSPGHRLYEEAKTAKHEPGLQPILPLLIELVGLCDQIHMGSDCPLYYPVADIANQLFCMQGPQWERVETEIRGRVERLVAEINSLLLTVTPAQLKDVENVILIAGTESKALAVRDLLVTERCNIRYLCTDNITANKILSKPPEAR